MIENNDNKIKNYAIFQDSVTITDVLLNKLIKIDDREFLVGYATIRIRKEYKCYFAIEVKKRVLDELDEDTISSIMGDTPFFIEYKKDSILYLRTKLSVPFLFDPNKSSLLNILNGS